MTISRSDFGFHTKAADVADFFKDEIVGKTSEWNLQDVFSKLISGIMADIYNFSTHHWRLSEIAWCTTCPDPHRSQFKAPNTSLANTIQDRRNRSRSQITTS